MGNCKSEIEDQNLPPPYKMTNVEKLQLTVAQNWATDIRNGLRPFSFQAGVMMREFDTAMEMKSQIQIDALTNDQWRNLADIFNFLNLSEMYYEKCIDFKNWLGLSQVDTLKIIALRPPSISFHTKSDIL